VSLDGFSAEKIKEKSIENGSAEELQKAIEEMEGEKMVEEVGAGMVRGSITSVSREENGLPRKHGPGE